MRRDLFFCADRKRNPNELWARLVIHAIEDIDFERTGDIVTRGVLQSGVGDQEILARGPRLIGAKSLVCADAVDQLAIK